MDEEKQDAGQKQKQTRKQEAKTVKMTLDGKNADVHPDMVGEYEKGGWRKA